MSEDEADGMTPDMTPDMADLFEALDTIGSGLSSGMRLTRVPEGLLERLRSATAPDAPSVAPASAATLASADSPPPAAFGDPASALSALQAKAGICAACVLSVTRKSVVFGQGVAAPKVLVVGEGPGAEEDNQGLPFVGASGKLLDKMLASIGLSRSENCYIANIVKCRPPNNREPAPDERAACMPFLREQIRILKPQAILCAGRTAAQALLETTEGINRLRTKQHNLGGIPLIATYHPSALLRDESLKRPAWEDLKRLRDLINPGHSSNE
ncbi:MAG: uracil-DNA glycosylase [Spirochaetales bacterium]|jgi:DNA polymerase